MEATKENLAANGHSLLKPNKFTEQRMPAWRPLLTTTGSILLLFIGGIIMLVLGIIFYLVLVNAVHVTKRYDDVCKVGDTCVIDVDIPRDIKGDIEIRYQLTKFYQNHRRYSFSRVDAQLGGDFVDYDGMVNCKPYRSIGDSKDPKNFILPCGLFAMTVFNDTFTWLDNDKLFSEEKITFKSEKEKLFKELNVDYTEGYKWMENGSITEDYFPEGNNYETAFPGGVTNPHFIVWMRTSTLPTVVKSYGRCTDCEIKKGRYQVRINSQFPTESFEGTKSIVIDELTPLGTRNKYLGIVYMACGSVCIACSLVLIISQLIAPRKVGEDRRKYVE